MVRTSYLRFDPCRKEWLLNIPLWDESIFKSLAVFDDKKLLMAFEHSLHLSHVTRDFCHDVDPFVHFPSANYFSHERVYYC